MIPRMPPPRLEGGNWSNALREFVALCLNEVPDHRPSAEELQKSKFVKSTKAPTTMMRELITRYEQWEKGGGVRASMLYHQGGMMGDTVSSEVSDPAWDFDTVKSRASGVPKEFDPLLVSGARPAVRGPPPSMPFQRGPRPRNGAERLYRLFEAPGEEEEWDEQPQQGQQFGGGFSFPGQGYNPSVNPSMSSASSSVGMISIPSFDEDGNLQTPDTSFNRPPDPIFNRAPDPIYNRAPSPIGMISIPSMPTEEELMEMARQKAAAAAAAAASAAPPATPSAAISGAPTITRTRPHRADSVGSSISQPVDFDGGPGSPQTVTPANFTRETSPQAFTRETSPRRAMVAASAPSSPPRVATPQQSGNMTPGSSSSNNGHKAHHLSSKSVPVFAGGENAIPPVPSINNSSAPTNFPNHMPGSLPHLKSRSQDITTALRQGEGPPARQPRLMGKTGQRPTHLNLGPSNSSNFDRLGPTSPGGGGKAPPVIHNHKASLSHLSAFPNASTSMTIPRPPHMEHLGGMEFPRMAPLDPTVLFQDPSNGEIYRELDRVLGGLGDALEVMEAGLKQLSMERKKKVPADEE
jgi:protein-serine/threonine kinase